MLLSSSSVAQATRYYRSACAIAAVQKLTTISCTGSMDVLEEDNESGHSLATSVLEVTMRACSGPFNLVVRLLFGCGGVAIEHSSCSCCTCHHQSNPVPQGIEQ